MLKNLAQECSRTIIVVKSRLERGRASMVDCIAYRAAKLLYEVEQPFCSVRFRGRQFQKTKVPSNRKFQGPSYWNFRSRDAKSSVSPKWSYSWLQRLLLHMKTRKRAVAKALHLEGRTTSRQTFWVFRFFWFENIVFGRLVYFRLATIRRHVAVETPTAQVK